MLTVTHHHRHRCGDTPPYWTSKWRMINIVCIVVEQNLRLDTTVRTGRLSRCVRRWYHCLFAAVEFTNQSTPCSALSRRPVLTGSPGILRVILLRQLCALCNLQITLLASSVSNALNLGVTRNHKSRPGIRWNFRKFKFFSPFLLQIRARFVLASWVWSYAHIFSGHWHIAGYS